MIPLNQLFLKGEEFWSKKKRSFRNPLNFMDRWIETWMWHVEFEDLNYIRLRPHIGCSPRSSFLRPVHHLCPNQNRWIHCIATYFVILSSTTFYSSISAHVCIVCIFAWYMTIPACTNRRKVPMYAVLASQPSSSMMTRTWRFLHY